ncbi:MAG: hypothetical protein JWQ35_835 [Bacteriovoracaceae bacterium]|nr:hypothetical protein [Bacteriovoracaceae bacterium]
MNHLKLIFVFFLSSVSVFAANSTDSCARLITFLNTINFEEAEARQDTYAMILSVSGSEEGWETLFKIWENNLSGKFRMDGERAAISSLPEETAKKLLDVNKTMAAREVLQILQQVSFLTNGNEWDLDLRLLSQHYLKGVLSKIRGSNMPRVIAAEGFLEKKINFNFSRAKMFQFPKYFYEFSPRIIRDELWGVPSLTIIPKELKTYQRKRRELVINAMVAAHPPQGQVAPEGQFARDWLDVLFDDPRLEYLSSGLLKDLLQNYRSRKGSR